MPHVVLVGDIKIESLFDELEPLFIKEDNTILRTSKRYAESGKESILVESMAIENGKKNEFLMLIGARDDGIVIRIHPMKDVEKTAGVKRILAETAKNIMSRHPELTVGKTNLDEWL
jgi:hypothetical protein